MVKLCMTKWGKTVRCPICRDSSTNGEVYSRAHLEKLRRQGQEEPSTGSLVEIRWSAEGLLPEQFAGIYIGHHDEGDMAYYNIQYIHGDGYVLPRVMSLRIQDVLCFKSIFMSNGPDSPNMAEAILMPGYFPKIKAPTYGQYALAVMHVAMRLGFRRTWTAIVDDGRRLGAADWCSDEYWGQYSLWTFRKEMFLDERDFISSASYSDLRVYGTERWGPYGCMDSRPENHDFYALRTHEFQQPDAPYRHFETHILYRHWRRAMQHYRDHGKCLSDGFLVGQDHFWEMTCSCRMEPCRCRLNDEDRYSDACIRPGFAKWIWMDYDEACKQPGFEEWQWLGPPVLERRLHANVVDDSDNNSEGRVSDDSISSDDSSSSDDSQF